VPDHILHYLPVFSNMLNGHDAQFPPHDAPELQLPFPHTCLPLSAPHLLPAQPQLPRCLYDQTAAAANAAMITASSARL
jgi:hypothetical protein